MGLSFRSLCSSSSGNCLLLCSGRATILFDCGFKTQTRCREVLDQHAPALDAVIVSHSHSDHINYAALRALAKRGVPVHAHQRVVEELSRRHAIGDWETPAQLNAFPRGALRVGDLELQPVEVPHEPGCTTCGFVVRDDQGAKMIVCTDFHHFGDVLDHFVDCDFVFLEANHDPGLLLRYPNYASRFHLSNQKAAWLLYHAVSRSRRAPRHVCLGHLSKQRNRPELAVKAVREVFARQGLPIAFELDTAPSDEPSTVFSIHPGPVLQGRGRGVQQLLFADAMLE